MNLKALRIQALALCGLLPGLSIASMTHTPGTYLFFENDGNWTTFQNKTSAIFVNIPSSYQDAASTCNDYGEELLSCDLFPEFYNSFVYQQYLGNLNDNATLWSSCNSSSSSTSSVSWTGKISSSGNSSLPFICTNSAPLVDRVVSNYSDYPRMNATVDNITFQGMRDHMMFRFAGIPYAKPPVGDLRFQYAEKWDSTNTSLIDATAYSPACLQTGLYEGNSEGLNPWGNDEDCLYLNVYTPFLPQDSSNVSDADLKPVMFWVHGGGFAQGTGSDLTFDSASLTSRSDVVVVTINYRLNIFGFLTLNDELVPGNYYLSDAIKALEWVQDYIRGFGGNPNNVTIFGQSAGGEVCNDLTVSPAAKDLFQGSIIMSGGDGKYTATKQMYETIRPYIDPLCNETGTERLACLQQLPADTLLEAGANITFTPILDEVYLPETPLALLAQGPQAINSIRYMGTFLPQETQSLIGTIVHPNSTDFQGALDALVESDWITAKQAEMIIPSDLWLVSNETFSNGSASFSSVYNASIKISTLNNLTCTSAEWGMIGAITSAFKSLHLAIHHRGYSPPYDDYYDLCTFPVGEPEIPYYRCHGSDLFEVFGSFHVFQQPIRVPDDVYYTTAVQDMWGSYVRTGDPNVPMEYLIARGYNTTIDFFSSGWSWPKFTPWNMSLASLDWPEPSYMDVPDLEYCAFLDANKY